MILSELQSENVRLKDELAASQVSRDEWKAEWYALDYALGQDGQMQIAASQARYNELCNAVSRMGINAEEFEFADQLCVNRLWEKRHIRQVQDQGI